LLSSGALRNPGNKEGLTVFKLNKDNSGFSIINQEPFVPSSLPYQWLVLIDQLTTSARGQIKKQEISQSALERSLPL